SSRSQAFKITGRKRLPRPTAANDAHCYPSLMSHMLWRCRHRTIDLTRPVIMGILNVTPDSFSDGGRYAGTEAALARAKQIVAEGAAIIDVGGQSTRPGAAAVEESVEVARVLPVIEGIAASCDVAISIDSSKPAVMAA